MIEMSSEEKKDLYTKLELMNTSLYRILSILESDNRTNTLGLVEEVRLLRAKVNTLEVNERIRKSQIAIYGGLGSAFVIALGWLFKQAAIFFIK
tara:strand:- start:1389 stop:1670 length:282 start_codon:yes stop_codon:yes gene_type:complete